MPPVGLFSFVVTSRDPATRARAGLLTTPHGVVETPAFMPVATQGAVKGVETAELKRLGTQILLANTYHLALAPGREVLAASGGLHRFMGWDGPLLTDSGGYQVFSLARSAAVDEEGVTFQDPRTGSPHRFTPGSVLALQEEWGVDIAMPLDQPVGHPAERRAAEEALGRTQRWAEATAAARRRPATAVFGIAQGAFFPDLRRKAVADLIALGFDGLALGGLCLGEPKPAMREAVEAAVKAAPETLCRYAMGVGAPDDLLECVERGVDLFDCVLPTRHGRNGWAHTAKGVLRIRHRRYRTDPRPLDLECPCPTCATHSRALLSHLFHLDHLSGPVLLSRHNLVFTQTLLAGARAALAAGRFAEFKLQRLKTLDSAADV